MPDASVPLSIIYNPKSGFHANQQDALYKQLISLWSEAGFNVQSFAMNHEVDFHQMMAQVLSRHQSISHGVVVAAGGDGTLNAVASYLIHTSIPMGILPLGTFNYVARVLNIPLDLMEAAHVIAQGHMSQVHVARVNQHIYLNNASLGLYPLFIQALRNKWWKA